MNAPPVENVALKRYAIFVAGMTFVLVWMGGMVTSRNVGLSVPDWPNTYGYNMFFFPPSKWIGGIFFEHTHRLVASAVGFLTIILALWLHGRNARPVLHWGGGVLSALSVLRCLLYPAHTRENLLLIPLGILAGIAGFVWPACPPAQPWLRRLGIIALSAVIVQGVLGGLRVTELDARLGIFHATLAQLFFLLISAIALFQTRFWLQLPREKSLDTHHFRFYFAAATVLIVGQLVLAATMRHQHAGLAIPDFPAAYGKWWPDTSPAGIARYNQLSTDATHDNSITAFRIDLQMAHRVVASIIFFVVGLGAWRTSHFLGRRHILARFSQVWFALILAQIGLGAATIWTGKAADVATAHVACGALCLVTGGLTTIVSFRLLTSPTRQIARQKNEMTSLLVSSSITSECR